MTSAEAYVALNLVPNIGPVRVRRLRDYFGNVEAILEAGERDLRQVDGIGAELAKAIRSGDHPARMEKEFDRADKLGLTIITPADDSYPKALSEIYDPPLALYIKGQVPRTWARGIGVVGSRITTHYGLEMAKKLSYHLAYAGVPVISGLARGIDTAAHQAALAAKGVTWAVLGCGLDQMYPPENQALADAIVAQNGCVMAEFPLGTPPDRRTFPMRNRIVSGLSFGVLVIEAGLDSGALITARQAGEQGRQVFAVPGRIDNPQAKGCHRLIKEGAKLVEGVEDVLEEYGSLFSPAEMAGGRAPEPGLTTARPAPVNLSASETKVFDLLDREQTSIDSIIQKTGLPSGEVSSTLLRLEMKKLVKQLPGKLFVRAG